jgi:hypothetical protein
LLDPSASDIFFQTTEISLNRDPWLIVGSIDLSLNTLSILASIIFSGNARGNERSPDDGDASGNSTARNFRRDRAVVAAFLFDHHNSLINR